MSLVINGNMPGTVARPLLDNFERSLRAARGKVSRKSRFIGSDRVLAQVAAGTDALLA